MDPTPPPLEAPPASAEPELPRKSATLFFVALVALFLPGLAAQALSRVLGLAWSEVFVFLLPSLVAAAGSNLRAVPLLGLGAPRARHVLLGALVGAAGFLVANGVMAMWIRLLPKDVVRLFDVSKVFDAPLGERIAIAAVASLVAPLCEEIAFRGYLQRTLALRRRPAVAIGAAAALFGVLHLDPVRLPALVVLGAVFGWLAWRAGSTWPAIAAHGVNNGLASALVLGGAADTGAEDPPVRAILFTFAFGLVGLALLVSAYRIATVPPPAADAVVRVDPEDRSTRFSVARIPQALWAAIAVGIALLLAMVLAARAGHPV